MTQNKVFLQGRVGQEVELRSTKSGTAVANVSIATEYSQKVDGNWEKTTVWHRVTAFGHTADFLTRYAQKGSVIGVEGHLSYSKYDKDGTVVYQTSIIVDEVTTLVEPTGKSEGKAKRYGSAGATALPEGPEYVREEGDQDIPF